MPLRTTSILSFVALVFLTASCDKKTSATLSIIINQPFVWLKKEPCVVLYSNNGDTLTIAAAIKCRGGVSSRYFKHSFALELNKKEALANLPKDDDWVLNANYIDKTFMRHKICYDLFREMGSKNMAPKSAYVNLNVNGVYEGLYLLMQKINATTLKLNKKDSLAMLFKDPPIFYELKSRTVQDSTNYYQQKFPKINQTNHTKYLEAFKAFLFFSNNIQFVQQIEKWVDLDNVIDWHLLLLFSNNEDGVLKNFYLYKTDNTTPFRFAIWDYDHSFGRDGDNALNLMQKEVDCNRSVLFKRLSQTFGINYAVRLKSRWKELRDNHIISIQNFESHQNACYAMIKHDVEKNFVKWPLNSKWYFDERTFDQELSLMRKFVKLRICQLDSRFGYK